MRGFRYALDIAAVVVAAVLCVLSNAAVSACDVPGSLSRVDMARLDQLAGPSGAGRRPIAAFADQDLVFAVFERMSTIVVPPGLTAAFAGSLSSDQITTVLLRRARGPALLPSAAPRILRATGATIVSVGRSDEHYVVSRDGRSYVVVPGPPGLTTGVCIDPETALLPARDAAVLAFDGIGAILDLGGERGVRTATAQVLFTSCCDLDVMRPDDLDLDPRHITDPERFARYLAAERFATADLSVDWTTAARIAHEALMQGRTQEAGQVLARLANDPHAASAVAVAMLADLASLGGRGEVAVFGQTPSSVREARARMSLARGLLAACREDAIETIADRRVEFAEVLPNLRALPADISTSIVLCEGRRLAVAGDPRAALARLRGPDRPAAIEEDPHWLALDAVLLASVGQDELADFRRRKLRALLLENGERIDLRPVERFVSPVALLGDRFVVAYLAGRGGSFGDRRIDVSAMASAISSLPPGILAGHLDHLAAWRSAIEEPALAARLDRMMARRLLGPEGAESAGSPAHAFQLGQTFVAASHLSDLVQDLRLGVAGFAVSAGLDSQARQVLGEFLAAADAGMPNRVGRFEEALDHYLALRRAHGESSLASDPVWQMPTRDPRLRVAIAERRSTFLAGIVRDALIAKPDRSGAEFPEFRLLERVRSLETQP